MNLEEKNMVHDHQQIQEIQQNKDQEDKNKIKDKINIAEIDIGTQHTGLILSAEYDVTVAA